MQTKALTKHSRCAAKSQQLDPLVALGLPVNTNWAELCWHFGLQSLYVSPGVTVDARKSGLVVADPFIWHCVADVPVVLRAKDHGNISHTVAKGSLPAGLMSESTWGIFSHAKSRKAWQNDRTHAKWQLKGSESRFIESIEDKMIQNVTKFNPRIYLFIKMTLSFAVTRQACSLYLFKMSRENNEKGLQQTMRVKWNACLAVNCKPSNNWSSKGPLSSSTALLEWVAAILMCNTVTWQSFLYLFKFSGHGKKPNKMACIKLFRQNSMLRTFEQRIFRISRFPLCHTPERDLNFIGGGRFCSRLCDDAFLAIGSSTFCKLRRVWP